MATIPHGEYPDHIKKAILEMKEKDAREIGDKDSRVENPYTKKSGVFVDVWDEAIDSFWNAHDLFNWIVENDEYSFVATEVSEKLNELAFIVENPDKEKKQ